MIVISVILVIVLFALVLLIYFANYLFTGVLDRESTWFNDVAHSLVNSDIQADHGAQLTERQASQLAIGTQLWQHPSGRWQVTSFDGLTLRGRSFLTTPKSDKWMICFHGYRTSARVDNGYIASRLLSQGYNCLLVDQRAHGESQGRYLTMGWLERRDVLTWSQWLIDQEAPTEIIWYGDSMGAATVLMASGEQLPAEVHGIIADCGYSSLTDLFDYLLKNAFHLPTWLPILPFFNLILKKKLGLSLAEVSAYDQLPKNQLPILFIHGDADSFVPLWMTEKNITATRGASDLLIVKEAPHFSSVLFDPEAYFQAIEAFLQTVSPSD